MCAWLRNGSNCSIAMGTYILNECIVTFVIEQVLHNNHGVGRLYIISRDELDSPYRCNTLNVGISCVRCVHTLIWNVGGEEIGFTGSGRWDSWCQEGGCCADSAPAVLRVPSAPAADLRATRCLPLFRPGTPGT